MDECKPLAGFQRLKLGCNKLVSERAFKFNLCRYHTASRFKYYATRKDKNIRHTMITSFTR